MLYLIQASYKISLAHKFVSTSSHIILQVQVSFKDRVRGRIIESYPHPMRHLVSEGDFSDFLELGNVGKCYILEGD